MVRCVAYIHELCMTWPLTSISKLYFLPWICAWQDIFALWHRHTIFWYMGVSPWDKMLCTFLTLVWPWLMTYMRVAGGILSEFYSQFLSCFCFLTSCVWAYGSNSLAFWSDQVIWKRINMKKNPTVEQGKIRYINIELQQPTQIFNLLFRAPFTGLFPLPILYLLTLFNLSSFSPEESR